MKVISGYAQYLIKYAINKVYVKLVSIRAKQKEQEERMRPIKEDLDNIAQLDVPELKISLKELIQESNREIAEMNRKLALIEKLKKEEKESNENKLIKNDTRL